MKHLLLLLATLLSLTSHGSHAQESSTERQQLIQLIETLTVVHKKGDACNEHMNYFGAKALEGAVCKEFKAAFDQHWPSRAVLTQTWQQLDDTVQQMSTPCSDCQALAQQADDLRVLTIYYLDYMDFLKEM
jgi:hypothetical protein